VALVNPPPPRSPESPAIRLQVNTAEPAYLEQGNRESLGKAVLPQRHAAGHGLGELGVDPRWSPSRRAEHIRHLVLLRRDVDSLFTLIVALLGRIARLGLTGGLLGTFRGLHCEIRVLALVVEAPHTTIFVGTGVLHQLPGNGANASLLLGHVGSKVVDSVGVAAGTESQSKQFAGFPGSSNVDISRLKSCFHGKAMHSLNAG
jgi:hypothetical protein